MVLISNGGIINIKNHHKIKCNEKKGENYNYSQNVNKIIYKYHGLLENKYTYEGSDEESDEAEAEAAKPVSKSKKK